MMYRSFAVTVTITITLYLTSTLPIRCIPYDIITTPWSLPLP